MLLKSLRRHLLLLLMIGIYSVEASPPSHEDIHYIETNGKKVIKIIHRKMHTFIYLLDESQDEYMLILELE